MSGGVARLGFAARVGGVLVAPRATLARLADGEARAGDIALLMCGWLVAGWLPLIARAFVLGVEAGLDAGLFGLMGTFQQLLPDVLGVLLAGIVMSLFVPKGARGHGRSADLAAYSWVPYLAVQVAGSLAYSAVGHAPSQLVREIVTGVAVAWAVVVWALAVDAARRPPSAAASSSATASAPSPSVSRWAGRALGAALVLLGALNAWQLARNWSSVAHVTTKPGALAPDFSAPLLDGGTLHLAAEHGHPVALVFWASWCGPCRGELPGVERIAERLKQPGHATRLYAVNTEGDRDAAAKAARELGLHMPVALDDGSISVAYQVQTIPHTVLLDGEGKVATVLRGVHSEADLQTAIDRVEGKR